MRASSTYRLNGKPQGIHRMTEPLVGSRLQVFGIPKFLRHLARLSLERIAWPVSDTPHPPAGRKAEVFSATASLHDLVDEIDIRGNVVGVLTGKLSISPIGAARTHRG